jgi:hypothetical protein
MSSDEDYSPSLGREVHSSVPEHEILLSFNDDWMAEAFNVWWRERGEEQWTKWVKMNEVEFQ